MQKREKTGLLLTESELLSIKARITSWSNKDQVIDIMRHRYGQSENQAA